MDGYVTYVMRTRTRVLGINTAPVEAKNTHVRRLANNRANFTRRATRESETERRRRPVEVERPGRRRRT